MQDPGSRISYRASWIFSSLDEARGSALEFRRDMPNRILIVDDEPLNLDLLDQELADLGHTTERATDGSEALLKLESTNPELILLDYQMPGMNGIEVLREIRKRDKNLPVVILTAYGTIERAVEAIKAGADDFITKPFDPEHLALVVNKALERAQLKSEVEFLAQELGGRYRLVTGKNPSMAYTVGSEKSRRQQIHGFTLGRERHRQRNLRPGNP
jgi:DNA-binding NtrC family response regulator